MKPTLYIETTIPSYLTAWKSTDLVMAGNQEATRSWWNEVRNNFSLFTSQVTIKEARAGNPEAAKRRLEILNGLPELEVSGVAENLANTLLQGAALPRKAEIDALHIAVASIHGMEYLLTWNCKHIANATMRPKIDTICRESGYEPPIICTPLELMEG